MSKARYRDYPHLISQGPRRNYRWPIAIANAPITAPSTPHVYAAPGMLDSAGQLTPQGRAKINAAIARLATGSKARYCVVWAEHDCTYYFADGSRRSGRRPPRGDLEANPADMDPTPLKLENVWYVELPEGFDENFICISRLGNFVEVTPGEPILVADFTTLGGPWQDSTLKLKANGEWKLPFRLRGVQVTSAEGDALYGPIQPRNWSERTLLRDPWPEDLVTACDKIAGAPLPASVHEAAWRAVDPVHYDMVHVGILRAA